MPYTNIPLNTTRPSDRKYEIHTIKSSNYYGNRPLDQIYVDEETGLIVSNIPKFEAWMKTLEN